MKKRVIYRILAEHGDDFSDCLAAAVGEILDMNPEPSQIDGALLLFKYKEQIEGTPDFWRELAAGAIIRKFVRSWLRKQNEKAALNNLGQVLGPISKHPAGPLVQRMAPPAPVVEADRNSSLLKDLPGIEFLIVFNF